MRVNVLVLIAGVHDPKWPITPAAALDAAAGAVQRIMSPFDEAALEMALRVREAAPGTVIAARVLGGCHADRIARSIAALNVHDIATVDFAAPWDQAALARAMVPLCETADLILMGREFGDFDDGLVPALLANLLSVAFFGRAQTVEPGGPVTLMRERGAYCERLAVHGRLLASVTNDRRTRLRKPLMKNVMMARQAALGALPVAAEQTRGLGLLRIFDNPLARATTDCDLLSGAPHDQAKALAGLLWAARA